MLLFLDRVPFHSWTHVTSAGEEIQFWSPSVQVIPADPVIAEPPSGAALQRWRLDTGCTGDSFAWRSHLRAAKLDPYMGARSSAVLLGGGSTRQEVLIRPGSLWIYSNIPCLRPSPFRLTIRGITFVDRDVVGPADFSAPVIGFQALRRSGVKVHLDFYRDTLSLWIPATWARTMGVAARRWLNLCTREPVRWA
jgi:hypothetical protein